MDKFELDRMIKILGENAPNNEAYFGITHDDYPAIEANKAGLFLFARQLLKASKLFEDRRQTNSEIRIEHGDWCKLHGAFESIQPVYEDRYSFLKNKIPPKRFNEKVKGFFASIIFLAVLILIIIGAVQVFRWIL